MKDHGATVDRIAESHGVFVETGRTMAELTTIGVGGPVVRLLRPSSMEALAAVLADLRKAGIGCRVVGGGANLVAGPGPFEEPIVLTRGIKHGPLFEGNRVRAGCGVVLKKLVRDCVAHGLSGLEFAEGIPGTVGGTVFMNAGSYGGQMGDVVREIVCLDPGGSVKRHPVGPADFSYRKSPLPKGEIIVEVAFELKPGQRDEMEARLKEISGRRIESQPPGERSAGCIFRNPPNDSAGRLIDSLGLKGMAVGGAMVSQTHGNFIVNRGDATPEDVIALIRKVKKTVKERSKISLEEEVVIWES